MIDALVIGAGPAGLMAADELAAKGHKVVVAEAKPTVGRKLLMAGKSGLNLTKDEPLDIFLAAYPDLPEALGQALKSFGPGEVVAWANALGQSTFTGSSGRVFPDVMKASPLLRAWLNKLTEAGVEFRTNWRWIGATEFETPLGPQALPARTTILAMGGASWARLGSDGNWTPYLADIDLAPFEPANMGFVVKWSDHMTKHYGAPVKSVVLKAGRKAVHAEFTISSRGIEGGGVYAISRELRLGAKLHLDLLPNLSADDIRARLAKGGTKQSLANRLRKSLKLDPVKISLLNEFARPLPSDLAPILKHLPVTLDGPRPMDEAISTAGGIKFDQLDSHLMLTRRPGWFAAGEMLDWEAPTGGYLLTACLASGKHAGRGAAAWLKAQEANASVR
jgi:uncharacterized flavoprotein (TIGR03862 family)